MFVAGIDAHATYSVIDNALAETIIGLYKNELVYPRGPWSRIEDVELATLEWVWWFNNHRLLGPLGHVPRPSLKSIIVHI